MASRLFPLAKGTKFLPILLYLVLILQAALIHLSESSAPAPAPATAPPKHGPAAPPTGHNVTNEGGGHGEEEGIAVVGFQIHELSTYIIILLFITVVIIVQILYHYLEFVASYIPESCILIGIGVCFGALLRYVFPTALRTYHLTPDLFFLILLPPIILEASFSLYNKVFADNLGVILIFAVVATVLNFLFIGFALYGLNVAGAMGGPPLTLTLMGYLLFASLIVAVDPVAVLAIFSEIGVDRCLYYMVFGESLLNDAVTIVLYGIMAAFVKQTGAITPSQIGIGIASFFTVSLGGLLVGVIVGLICCIFTRFTHALRTLEPMIIFTSAYFAYILGDLFEWSGIISMVGCGLVQSAYAFHNISWKSLVCIRRASKVMASISEAIIFLFLGTEIFITDLVWHTGFHLWSMALCLIARFIIVLFLCAIINWAKFDQQKISWTEQFILGYGGLRGAVAFSLSVLIEPQMVGGKENVNLILTCTLFIIFFTVVLMGISMKPIVKLMKVRLEPPGSWSLFGQMNETITCHLLAALETIDAHAGRNRVRLFFQRLDNRYVRRILQRDPETHDQKIVKTYQKVALAMHYAGVNPSRSTHYLERLSSNLKRSFSSMASFGSMASLNPSASTSDLMGPYPDPKLIKERRASMTVGPQTQHDADRDVMEDALRRARNPEGTGSEADFFSRFSDVMKNKERAIGMRQKSGGGNPGSPPAYPPSPQVGPNASGPRGGGKTNPVFVLNEEAVPSGTNVSPTTAPVAPPTPGRRYIPHHVGVAEAADAARTRRLAGAGQNQGQQEMANGGPENVFWSLDDESSTRL